MTFTTRFAPSPTGPLHLGHAYSALLAYDMALEAKGIFLLRIEDNDAARCTPEFEQGIYDDLSWLGLSWPEPVLRQSEFQAQHLGSLELLTDRGLTYPCSCSRGDIRRALSAPQEGDPKHGPDGVIYPGTCRDRPMSSRLPGDAIRLNMGKAVEHITGPLEFTETGDGEIRKIVVPTKTLINEVGDVVLARKDIATPAYHLSVVLDDAAQGITHVIRGKDLFDATKIHVLLQQLLGLPTPVYHHHRLIRDEDGKRLAKRDDARAVAVYRAAGKTPQDIREMVGLTTETTGG